MQAESFAMPETAGPAASRSQPGLQGHRLVMRDNVHLFDPGAEHHEVLATEGTATTSRSNSTMVPSPAYIDDAGRMQARRTSTLCSCMAYAEAPL